jgi:hypothetical protein
MKEFLKVALLNLPFLVIAGLYIWKEIELIFERKRHFLERRDLNDRFMAKNLPQYKLLNGEGQEQYDPIPSKTVHLSDMVRKKKEEKERLRIENREKPKETKMEDKMKERYGGV